MEAPVQSAYYEIQSSDVGRGVITAFGRQWRVVDFIGSICLADVGKRVYRTGDIVQVENDEQRATRIGPVTTPEVPMALDELKRMLNELARTLRLKLGDRSSVIIAAGFPSDVSHDRFASVVTGPCLTARGLLAWSQRSVEKQIDEADSSMDENGRIK
jgi:hypothetical protein